MRADQATFREEILSSGFALVSEPVLPELEENYVMIFRPKSNEEQVSSKETSNYFVFVIFSKSSINRLLFLFIFLLL